MVIHFKTHYTDRLIKPKTECIRAALCQFQIIEGARQSVNFFADGTAQDVLNVLII
jgi:hypothetical protein